MKPIVFHWTKNAPFPFLWMNLDQFGPGSFKGMKNLIDLRIEDNSISAIGGKYFRTMKNVKDLNLSRNMLSLIGPKRHIFYSFEWLWTNLDQVHLKGWKLDWFQNRRHYYISNWCKLFAKHENFGRFELIMKPSMKSSIWPKTHIFHSSKWIWTNLDSGPISARYI